MRKFAIMFGCAALLSMDLAAAGPLYRVSFHFAKAGANDQIFFHDRVACLRQTSTEAFTNGPSAVSAQGVSVPGQLAGTFYVRHANAFYQCMTAKGYRADPNGPFKVSFGSEA